MLNTPEQLNENNHEILVINDRLTLRQLQPNNAQTLFNIVDTNREYLSQYLPWVASTKSANDSREFIEKTLSDRKDHSTYGYGIFIDGEFLGHISIMNLNNDQKKPEIGYWIAESASGKGITTNAVKTLTKFGLNTLNLKEIIICADPNNIASNKVAQKAGYQLARQYNDPLLGLHNEYTTQAE